MKQEFKWILDIELEVDEDEVGTDSPERLCDEANYAFECAQNKFFDVLNANENITSWIILHEELK